MPILNHSRTSTWQRCHRKYYWRYIRHLKRKQTALPLMTGTAIHAGLATHYLGGDEAAVLQALEQSYQAEVGDITNYLPEERDAIEAELEMAKGLIRAYRARYANEAWTVVAVEAPFLVPLGDACGECNAPYPVQETVLQIDKVSDWHLKTCPGCGAGVYLYAGRLDLVALDRGRFMVVDHKSPRTAGAMYMKTWAKSFQLIGYDYGARSLGTTAQGHTINVLKKLKTAGAEKPRGEAFLREYYPIGVEDFDLFLTSRLRIAADIEAEAALTAMSTAYPMNDEACYAFWTACPYLSLCWDNPRPRWWDLEDVAMGEYEAAPIDYVDLFREEEG